jgi:hypothetical protein
MMMLYDAGAGLYPAPRLVHDTISRQPLQPPTMTTHVMILLIVRQTTVLAPGHKGSFADC